MSYAKYAKYAVWLHIFVYHTYFACDAYIVQVHLIWSKDAVNTDTTPVQRDRRQAQRGVRCIMVFIQKTSNFIWKHRKHCIFAHLSSIAMQNHFPSQSMVTPVVSATSSQEVCNEASNLGAVPYVDSNAWKIAAWQGGICRGVFLEPAVCPEGHTLTSSVLRNFPVVCFLSIINSRCNQQNMINMHNMSKIDKYAEYALHIRKIQ